MLNSHSYFLITPLKFFTTTLWVQLDIFQPLISLTTESPSVLVTGSLLLSGVSLSVLSLEFSMFWVIALIAFCFAVIFCSFVWQLNCYDQSNFSTFYILNNFIVSIKESLDGFCQFILRSLWCLIEHFFN